MNKQSKERKYGLWLLLSICCFCTLLGKPSSQSATATQMQLVNSSNRLNDKPQLVVQLGHTDDIRSMALSANGRYLVTASKDRSAILWDMESGRELRRFTFRSDWKPSSEGVPEDAILLSEMGLKINPKYRTQVDDMLDQAGRDAFGYSASFTSVALSDDGRYVATGGDDKIAQLWDAGNGKELRRFEGHTASVNSVALTTDGRYLVTGSGDRTARLWDLESGRELRSFAGHSGKIHSVGLSSNGKNLVTGGSDGMLFLWDVQSGREINRFGKYTLGVKAALLSRDGRHILSVGQDGDSARLWDVTSSNPPRRFSEGGKVTVESIALSNDGRYLVTGNWLGGATLWDVASRSKLRNFDKYSTVTSMVMSNDGNFLVTGGKDGKIVQWDIASGNEIRRFESKSKGVTSIATSGNGQLIAIGNFGETSKLWEVRNRSELRSFGEDEVSKPTDKEEKDDDDTIDLNNLFTSGKQGDMINPRKAFSFSTGNKFNPVTMSEDGRYLVIGSSGGIAHLWDIENASKLHDYDTGANEITSVALNKMESTS